MALPARCRRCRVPQVSVGSSGAGAAARPQGRHSLAVVCTQDNQTDSGMVLASEEFEQLESRHRQEGGLR